MGGSVPFFALKKYVGMFFMFGCAYFSFDVLKNYLKKEYSLSVFDGLSELELRQLEDFFMLSSLTVIYTLLMV